jgi:type II secretory pathway pseudopilin PulG
MIGSGDWRLWPWRPASRRPARSAAGDQWSAGYNLVVLAVAITVLNILVAKALPLWSHVIQREKETELIFRGLQYAEAIRLFEGRAQRLPTRLEELIKVKPRCIRQLWKNPMTEDGSWGLIFQDQQGRPGQPQQDPSGRRRRQQQQQQQQFGVPGGGKEVRVGPIVGVYSPEGGEAIKVFAPLGGGGGSEISEWKFTRDLLQGLGMQTIGAPGAPQVPSMNASGIGKPWPPGITLPQAPGGGGRQGPRGIGINQPGRRPAGQPGSRQPGNAPPRGRDLGGRSGRGGG